MANISRRRRAEIQRQAHLIRQQGQRAGWRVEQIATTISRTFHEVTALEAWRLAYGWSRRQAIEGIAKLYVDAGLAPPPVNTSMLCRWEHGTNAITFEYADALTRLYRASPAQLGLTARTPAIAAAAIRGWYGRYDDVTALLPTTNRDGDRTMTDPTSDNGAAALAALRESIQLALDTEGPAGGPLTTEQLQAAVDYYALNYATFPPGLLAGEVHQSRRLATAALTAGPAPGLRSDLRRLAGWLSALLGNLAFHLGDYPAAHIHLATAARLGIDVGDRTLASWSIGAQSMVARYQRRAHDALDLANQALEHTATPLRRAQLLAWTQLPALALLGRRDDAEATIRDAQHHIDRDPIGHSPGRFGFDHAELQLHIAEAHLTLSQPASAATHANGSLDHTRPGRPSWAAATVVLARTEARLNRPDQAADLAHTVLDRIPGPSLRQTTRNRLHDLDNDLQQLADPGRQAQDLHDRLVTLTPLSTLPDRSDEGPGSA